MTPDDVIYLVNAGLWSLVGFILGFLVCHAYFHDRPNMTKMRIVKPKGNAVMGIVIVLLSLITVYNSIEAADQQKCQESFGRKNIVATQQYRDYAKEDRESLVKFFRAVGSVDYNENREKYLDELLQNYELTQNKREKINNPSLSDCG